MSKDLPNRAVGPIQPLANRPDPAMADSRGVAAACPPIMRDLASEVPARGNLVDASTLAVVGAQMAPASLAR